MNKRRDYDLERLENYCKENNVTLLEDYCDVKINRDSYIKGNCCYNNCNSLFEKRFRELLNAGGYCSVCIQIVRNNKRKQNNFNKLGTEEPTKLYTIQKLNEICSVNNIKLTKIYSEKIFGRSIIEGICVCCENDNFKRTLKDIIKNNNFYCLKCKYKNANIIRESTNMEKYGVKIISQNKAIQEKIKNNCIAKYGVYHTGQLDSVKKKFKQTCLIKYGVENISQNAEIAEKASNNGYKIKKYELPSGKIIKCQGYEPFALRDLIALNINEDDIVNEKPKVPEIWFNNNNKEHRYYVDIYIPSQNKCIEVKSIYTYKKYKQINLLKRDAAKKLGYSFEFWIYDNNGNRINNCDDNCF